MLNFNGITIPCYFIRIKIWCQSKATQVEYSLLSNGLVVKALDSQSRGPVFKTTGWLQG